MHRKYYTPLMVTARPTVFRYVTVKNSSINEILKLTVVLLHVTDNKLKIPYLLRRSKNMKPRHVVPKRQKIDIPSTVTLYYLELPLLISPLEHQRFHSCIFLAHFRTELCVPVPHIPWVLQASPPPPLKCFLACIQVIFCEALKIWIFTFPRQRMFRFWSSGSRQISRMLKTLSLRLQSM